jgi:GT2 family glycosyltransferase
MDTPTVGPTFSGQPSPLPISQAPDRDDRAAIVVTRAGTTTPPFARAGDAESATRLHIVIADQLAGGGFLVAGWFADPLGQVQRVSVGVRGGEELALASHAVLLAGRSARRAFGTPPELAVNFAFVLLVPGKTVERKDGLRVWLHCASGETRDIAVPAVGDASQLADIVSDLATDDALRVAEHLLGGWRQERDAARRVPEALQALAERAHKGINPQHNHGATIGAGRVECFVDAAIRVGTTGMLVRGWLLHDDADTIEEIALVNMFGRRVPLDIPLPAIARPDVLEAKLTDIASRNRDCGFVTFAAVDGLNRDDTLWFMEVVMQGGAIKRMPFVCPPAPEPVQGIEATVMLAEASACNLPDLFARAIAPAVETFWGQIHRQRSEPAEILYGVPPTDPQVSIVVPIYGRIDFIRHQIAQFSNDREFRTDGGIVDLIYVLDDPSKADVLRQLGQIVHGVYGVPFRVLLQRQNLGYSAANNAGAAAARGSLLLLLNSDVFPRKTRWIGQLARRYRGLDRCGVLGCRLLFEDGSIQHAGMTFRQTQMVDGCWANDHPGKGFPVAFDAGGGPRQVPAVTGACMMVDRRLFRDLGGMSEHYVIGDFEDSDLCLKAYERGLLSYYTPEVELYHLERQSMRLIGHGHIGWRQSLTLYNMWKHSRRWGDLIPRVLAELAPPANGPALHPAESAWSPPKEPHGAVA